MKTIHNKNKFQLVSDKEGRKEILLNDALNTFYLWLGSDTGTSKLIIPFYHRVLSYPSGNIELCKG